VCTTEGEVDILTEVLPTDAATVENSEHARLVTVDAMRLVSGVINRGAADVPLDDVRARRALNLAVDRDRIIKEVFAGHAHPISAMTPPYAAGVPEGQQPYPQYPERPSTFSTSLVEFVRPARRVRLISSTSLARRMWTRWRLAFVPFSSLKGPARAGPLRRALAGGPATSNILGASGSF
jgi:hypothetical protein